MSMRSGTARKDLQWAVLAGSTYFAIVFAAGFVLGAVRILLLVPRLGASASVLVELPVLLGIAWLVCRRLLSRFAFGPALAPRLVMGGTAFVLLMGTEAGLSVLAFGRPITEYLAQLRELPSLLGLAGQIVFALLPALRDRHS